MTSIAIEPFPADHAERLVALFARAFGAFSEDTQPRDSVEQVARIFGPANPAGVAWVAHCSSGGRCLASLAGLPMRYRTPEGQQLTGYQISSFAIDPELQRQGLGLRLLGSITEHLSAQNDAFIYAFPNRRSMSVLTRLGYERLRSVPTLVRPVLPVWRSEPGGRPWTWRQIGAAEALALSDTLRIPSTAGFVRDPAWFTWRFLGADAEASYRFMYGASDGRQVLVVATPHAFKGLRFLVLVDVLADAALDWRALAQAASRMARAEGAAAVYVNTTGPFRALPVPARFNPRPIELLVVPSSQVPTDLKETLFMTADWMGF